MPRRATVVAVLAPALDVPLVVVALVLGLPIAAAGGAAVVLVGALALAAEAVATVRARGRWTTDPGLGTSSRRPGWWRAWRETSSASPS